MTTNDFLRAIISYGNYTIAGANVLHQPVAAYTQSLAALAAVAKSLCWKGHDKTV